MVRLHCVNGNVPNKATKCHCRGETLPAHLQKNCCKGNKEMKKILTLAIALVMVFAIAAPAFASGWDIDPEPAKEIKDITLAIDALSLEKDATAGWNDGAGKAYSILEKTYPVIAGTKVHAVITVTIPKKANLSDDMIRYMQNGKLKLKIETSNLNVEKIEAVGTNGWKDANAANVIVFGAGNEGYTFTFEITANAKASDKDAKIVAKLGVYNEWENYNFNFEKNGKTYNVWKEADQFVVISSTGAKVTFPVVGEKIDTTRPIEVDDCAVTKQVDSTLAFVVKGSVLSDVTDPVYKDLKAQMDEIYGVLGFDYEGAKYMRRAHFEKFFGTVMEGTDGLTYPAGYIAELVTDDPSVNPPQTGDNASVVGFVMIAVALVAAAAVTVKKVRA